MKKSFLIALLLIPLAGFGQNRVQDYIDRQMKTDSLLINAVVGILAVDEDGSQIAAWNPDMPLLTASTMKTITTGLGYEVLGPDYRFRTRVAYDGRIEKGILHGNLYIVGGADPTLGSRHDRLSDRQRIRHLGRGRQESRHPPHRRAHRGG